MANKTFSRTATRFWYDWTVNNTTGVTSPKNQHGRSFTWNNQVDSSERNPDWRSKIANGINATTRLFYSGDEVNAQPSYFLYKKQHISSGVIDSTISAGDYHDVGLYPHGFTIASLGVINRSLIKFYEDLASQETHFKGLTFSGELKESLMMIRHPARSLRRGVSAYLSRLRSRGPRLPFPKRPKFVRDTWLEYSFGWRPLIKDINDAMTAIQTSGVLRPMFIMCRGAAGDSNIVAVTNFTYNPTTSTLLSGQIYDLEECYCKHYGVYKSQQAQTSVPHNYGFSLSEFVPTLWELIPYSFLVDYFTNIGGILEALSYRNLGVTFASRTLVQKGTRVLRSMKVSEQDPPPGYKKVSSSQDCGSYEAKKVVINRTPDVGTPIPSLSLKVPGNWTQWTNIAALSKQLESTRKSLNRR